MHEFPVRKVGGADRDRTDDLRLAKPALSQLSYSPSEGRRVVGLGRLELPTSRLSGGRSNRAELQAPTKRSDPVRSSDRAPALGPRKTNVVRRRLRVNGRKLPRSNESPGEPGIHSFAAIRLAPATETELDLGFEALGAPRVSLERR
jgi:hypothetical protein